MPPFYKRMARIFRYQARRNLRKQSKPPGGVQLDGYSCYPIYPICMSQLQTYNHTKASAFVLTDNIIKQADRLFFSNFNRP
jgi:hypothetical protein